MKKKCFRSEAFHTSEYSLNKTILFEVLTLITFPYMSKNIGTVALSFISGPQIALCNK